MDVGNWPGIAEFGQSINIDSAVTRGVELNGRYAFNKQWSTSANYTYTKSEQKSGASAGLPLTDTPKHAVNLRVDWKPSARWSAWARAEYRSERYRGNPATDAATKALGNYKAYAQFHVGGSYRVTPKFVLNGAIFQPVQQKLCGLRRLPKWRYRCLQQPLPQSTGRPPPVGVGHLRVLSGCQPTDFSCKLLPAHAFPAGAGFFYAFLK